MKAVKIILLVLFLAMPVYSGVFSVRNTSDSGEHSFRWALQQTNTHAGPDTITFNLSTSEAGYNGAAWIIALQSALPALSDSATFINGASQRNTNPAGPEIFLDGRAVAGIANGLVISSGYNTVAGLGIIGFSDNGILITDAKARQNHIFGCTIGVAPDGATSQANAGHGVYLKNAGAGNILGGEGSKFRNVISGNGVNGVQIEKTDSTVVAGNFIGCDVSGSRKLGNQLHGIFLYTAAAYTRIGGDKAAEGNVISANLGHGVLFQGNLVKNCVLRNNMIGADAAGTLDLGNERYGLYIYGGSSDNTIGPFNHILFNKKYGIGIAGSYTLRNQILQNSISNNMQSAVQLSSGANAGVLPPGNLKVTAQGVSGTAPGGSVVEIYSDPAEEGAWFEAAITSDRAGHFLWAGVPKGPSITATVTDGDGNTSEFCPPLRILPFVVTTTLDSVEGSLRWAINGSNITPDADRILFDIPQTDPGYQAAEGIWVIKPTKALPILTGGQVEIDGRSQTVGHGDSNPFGPEIFIDGSLAGDRAKGLEIRSAQNWLHDIGIGGFSQNAIVLYGDACRHNRVTGCFVGLKADGKSTLPNNSWSGIVIASADSNIIGGVGEGLRNVIGGMGLQGILLSGISCTGNKVQNNYVGLDVSGSRALPNLKDGIRLEKGPANNLIGGSGAEYRNICSGNIRTGIRLEGAGVDSNVVAGNWIGLNAAGSDSLANGESGLVLADHAMHNLIGGADRASGNMISGNRYSGLQIRGNSDLNVIANNTIGLSPDRGQALPNAQHGVFIYNAAAGNIVGPANVIAANGRTGFAGSGLVLDGTATKDNQVMKNFIGAAGDKPFGNTGHGVYLANGSMENKIGPENVIAHNAGDGVRATGDRTVFNTITRNAIHSNGGAGIELLLGANLELLPPIFAPRANGTVYGKTHPYAVVEIFGASDGEGARYLGSATADVNGDFSVMLSVIEPSLTATAMDVLGNTSEFVLNNPTAVSDETPTALPQTFALEQNHPNPFNDATLFSFSLPAAERVTLSLYNLAGQKVSRILDRTMPAGAHQLSWEARDDNGLPLTSGVYYYVLAAGNKVSWKKMILLR